MNPNKASLYLILVSLVAATAIIVWSYLLDGADSSQTIMFLIIAVWFVPFTWLTARAGHKKPESENKELES